MKQKFVRVLKHLCHLTAVAEAVFFFQAEDGIRDCLLSRGLGDVYKRQDQNTSASKTIAKSKAPIFPSSRLDSTSLWLKAVRSNIPTLDGGAIAHSLSTTKSETENELLLVQQT